MVEAVRHTLTDPALDPAFVAEAVLAADRGLHRRPDGRGRSRGDPRRARERCARELGRELEPLWRAAYAATAANRFELSPAAKGARRLRTVALGYLMAVGRGGRAGAGAAAVRRGRQHDRPAGRAHRPRQQRGARAGDGARRLLRALSGQCAGASTNGSPRRRSRPATTRCRRCSSCSAIPISRSAIRTGCAR